MLPLILLLVGTVYVINRQSDLPEVPIEPTAEEVLAEAEDLDDYYRLVDELYTVGKISREQYLEMLQEKIWLDEMMAVSTYTIFLS